MNSASPGETGDLGRRITRLLLLRTLVISVVLGLSLWVLWIGEQPAQAAMYLQSSIIAATYVSSIVFGVMLRRGVRPSRVARPMQVADIVVTSLLIYITGGAQSPYVFLYALSIVGAGAISFRRGAIVTTIASVSALAVVSLLAWTHAIDLPLSAQINPWEQSGAQLVRTLGIDIATIVGVGALSLIFGDQLQRGAETLATTRRAAADLLTLHQDIVRSLSSGLVTIDPDGTVLTINEVGAEILAVTDAVGKPIETILPGLTRDPTKRSDLVIGEVTLGVTVSPLVDIRDEVIGRVVNFQDLTELRRLENHIRRAERLATVGQLAAGVAHEIRNPLASISGSIELLRSMPQASEDDRTLMAIVNREVLRLNALIGDLLDYANPKPLQPVDLDIAILIDETVTVAKGDPAFADVDVATEIERPLQTSVDPSKLRQVLWNLLRNAADAALAGGKHVKIVASAGDELTITVADDGPGIPADQIAQIFDPFFTTKRRGTGLGLATSHGIVADHGGRIDVESTVGEGTKMIVSLPRR